MKNMRTEKGGNNGCNERESWKFLKTSRNWKQVLRI